MSDEKGHPTQELDPLDVRKPGRRTAREAGALQSPLRAGLRALGELLGGVAEASAEAFRGFSGKLEEKKNPLTSDVLEGLAEGNARFLEEMAKVSRKVSQSFKAEEGAPAQEIDYQRLAKHVVEEMQKAQKEEKP